MTHPLVHALVELGSSPAQTKQPETRTTKGVVASMLTENTGSHMLDSGGAYGRGWERNQGRDFDAEPIATVSWKYGYIDVTLNLYHLLTEAAEYEEELDRAFEAWCYEEHHKGENWFTCIEDFIDAIEQGEDEHPTVERFREDVEMSGGNPWTGENSRWTINTYNGEDLLSQVIQYTMFGDLVFLQIHGGCDVRGGYTQPRVFRLNEWPALIDNAKATLSCTNGECNAYWTTDDGGCHWYLDGWSGSDLPGKWLDITETENRAKLIVEQAQRQLEEEHPVLFNVDPVAHRESEFLFIDSDEDYALCPVCLNGRLEASY